MILSALRGYSVWSDPTAWTGSADVAHAGVKTSAGRRVTESNAIAYSAVYSAISLISEALGIMPFNVFRRVKTGRDKLTEHRLRPLINSRPNPEQSSQQFRECLQGWCLAWGNGYAEIQRDTTGRPVWLWPIAPNRVHIKRDADRTIPATARNPLVYEIRNSQSQLEAVIPAGDMFHVRNFTVDGFTGLSTVRLARESIGLGLAAEQFGAQFFGNGTHPGGVITSPKDLEPKAKRKLKDQWIEGHGGPAQLGVAILDEGMDWKTIGIPPEDAQFLQTRVFQIQEIARWFKVPPTELGELSRAHFKNIEHLAIRFVTRGLLQWVKRWEHETDWKLLSRAERANNEFTRLNTDAQLRGDTPTRGAFYKTMNAMGVLSINNILELEDMNTIGPDGDRRFVPLNLVPLSEAQRAAESRAPKAGGVSNASHTQAVEHAALRTTHAAMLLLVAKEANAAKRGAGKPEFKGRVNSFYVTHSHTMADALRPFALSLAEVLLNFRGLSLDGDHEERLTFVVEEFVAAYCDESRRALGHAEANGQVAELCGAWQQYRSDDAARNFVERIAATALSMSGNVI